MAVPKRRTSKARRDKRRSHKHLTAPSFSQCPQCHELRLPHRVCPTCGYYNGRPVLEVEEV
ncbi:LSU ribosomal protein L32P [Desulfacinum infernum DSM 9756]|jgi:large subunit ribosomal protein L32|uniref:Large ribosomal subunit protein bL32 n=1 Tax=Desulfacinum infernum DSM 9756 TaxID=1121391 RepID=A0A1M5DHN1_9BACT|nr:50S ribosomal protein L32 [Desulfacinum infernum]MBC7357802.1 50S ribosomal protein L32 [Desulfacinum sp.]MBZ4659921.1 ribosomal protein [Desulfacinum sp.]SHF66426.1 LSU ribosomal protein L32P [Desulfacinum infernum DSM 9756]